MRQYYPDVRHLTAGASTTPPDGGPGVKNDGHGEALQKDISTIVFIRAIILRIIPTIGVKLPNQKKRISQYNGYIHAPTIGEVNIIFVWNPTEFGILVLKSILQKQ